MSNGRGLSSYTPASHADMKKSWFRSTQIEHCSLMIIHTRYLGPRTAVYYSSTLYFYLLYLSVFFTSHLLEYYLRPYFLSPSY